VNESGFLSEELAAVRAIVRDRYKPQREFLLNLNHYAVTTQHSITIAVDSNVERYGAVLFARTLASTQSAVILLEHGLVPQARTVLRSALETMFSLAAIAERPSVVDKLVETHRAEQCRVAKNLVLWKSPELQAIAATELASGKPQQFHALQANAVSAYDLAKIAGLEDLVPNRIHGSQLVNTWSCNRS